MDQYQPNLFSNSNTLSNFFFHLPVRRVNKILNEGFWWTSCWPLGPPPADTLLLMLMLLVSTVVVALFAVVLALALDALLLFSVSISTLKRTFRDKNLSGDRYSQRNKLGLFMLCMRSWVCKDTIKILTVKQLTCKWGGNLLIEKRVWGRLWRCSAACRWSSK